MNYMMKADGSFYRILIAPVRRASIVAGQLLEAVLCTFLEVFIMGTISLLFSVEFSAGIGAFLLAILLVFLAAFFISGMAYGIKLRMRSHRHLTLQFFLDRVHNAQVLRNTAAHDDRFLQADAVCKRAGLAGYGFVNAGHDVIQFHPL